jgi:hypothetical protein
MAQVTPLGAVARGLAAGLAGTAAMTAYQEVVALVRGGGSNGKLRAWKEAPAPAQVGRRILKGVFQVQVPLEKAPLLTNVVHWATGTAWGAVYGVVEGTVERPPLPMGAAFGAGVWAASYAQLVPMGIYKPPWKYSPATIALDLSYHLVYGVATAAAYEAISRRV